MNLGIEGKVALVTASTNGIGRETAKAFLQEGAIVFINGRDEKKLLKMREELGGEYGDKRVYFVCGDAADENTICSLYDLIEAEYGRLDILVPNLGSGKPISENRLDVDEWQYMMELNLFSAVKLINKFRSLLMQGNNPSITMLSSIAALEKLNAPYAYAAAKASILTLIKYLSDEYAKDNIRVNGVIPGNIFFKGGRWEELLVADRAKTEDYIRNNVPLKRFGRPEEIANAIAFLASECSLFTTGSTLVVDGGQRRG